MKVNLVSFGKEERELELDEGATVAHALASAGVELSSDMTVSVNGERVATDTHVKEGDVVIATPKIANG